MPTARARGMDSMCDRARRQKRVSASFFAVLVPFALGPAACPPAGLVDRRTVCLPAPCGAGSPTEDAGRPGTRIRGPLVGRRCARYRPYLSSVLLATFRSGRIRLNKGGCGGVPDKWFNRLVGSDIAKRQNRSMSNYAVSLAAQWYRFTLFCLFTGPARRDAQRDAGRQSGLPPPPAP